VLPLIPFLRQKRVPELDGLRGVACLAILLFGCIASNIAGGAFPGLYRLQAWLLSGFDLFLVLSGFLIAGQLLDSTGSANFLSNFWIRRLARVLPVFYLLVLTFFLMQSLKSTPHPAWLDVLLFDHAMPLWTYPLFMQNFAQAADGGSGGAQWVALTWLTAVEMQFYVVIPFLIRGLTRRALVKVALTCIVLALAVRAAAWAISGSWFTGYFLLPGRMDALMLGVLVAVAIRDAPTRAWFGRHRLLLDGVALCIIALLSTNVVHWLGGLFSPPVSFAVNNLDISLNAALFAYAVLRVFMLPRQALYRRFLASRVLVSAGLISYPLYMYHLAIVGLVHGLVYGDQPRITDLSHLITAIGIMLLSIGLAVISTIWIETPVLRWARRTTERAAPLGVPAFSMLELTR
jgi:peptidoglycan/LPS O-acetylase OafA/YrhL